jgi:hypothetical protein
MSRFGFFGVVKIAVSIALVPVFFGGFLLGLIVLCIIFFGINPRLPSEEIQFWTIETLLSGLGVLLLLVLDSLAKLPKQAGG